MGLESDVRLLRRKDSGPGTDAGIGEAGQRRPLAVDLLDEDAAGDGRLHFRAAPPGVEAPLLRAGGLVPKVALGTGHARIAFRAHGMLGKAGGFRPHAHGRRPDKGRGAAPRAGAQPGVAEGGLGELHARGKGAGIGAPGLAEVAYLKEIAVVQVGLALREGFHEHSRRARIAEIEHEVHIHGHGLGIDHAHGGDDARRVDGGEEGQIGGQMLHAEGRGFAPDGFSVMAGGLVGVVDVGNPFVHPQGIEKPRVVPAARREGEAGVFGHVFRRKGEVLPGLLFALLRGRVEEEGQGIGAAVLVPAHMQARPVARPALAFEPAVLPLLARQAEEGHGNPAPGEGFQRALGGDGIIIVPDAPLVVGQDRDEFRGPAGRGDRGGVVARHLPEIRGEFAEALKNRGGNPEIGGIRPG